MSLPVLTAEQMRAWEAASWAVKVSVHAVVGMVGERLAARLKALVAPGRRVLLLAGKGHNGDDVRAAVPHLGGLETEIINVHDPVTAFERVRTGLSRSPAWVVDGLFGIGLKGDLPPIWCQLLETINAAGIPVMAVDIPSGLNPDTGLPQGAALVARLTVTVGTPKIGLLKASAVPYVGRLEVAAGIGLTPSFQPPSVPGSDEAFRWTESRDFIDLVPPRSVASHKGDFGHLLVIAGSQGYHGAAVLAARAALRTRPGLVTVLTSPEAYAPIASQLTSVMVAPWREESEFPGDATALVVGPGLAGREVPEWLRQRVRQGWAESPATWIADASALDWIRDVAPRPNALRVWTPHPGEASRLLGCSTEAVQGDRLASARRLSHGIWTILKGHQTLVVHPSGLAYVNPSGNPGLAQGGSGDVLAGYVGGWLAQPSLSNRVDTLLRYSVWDHGAAADRLELRPIPWTPDDLIENLGIQLQTHPADPLNPR